jgi:putative transposase
MPHTFTQLHVHAVFSTKNRVPFLADKRIRARVHAYMAEVMRRLKCPAELVGGIADHVHVLFNLGRACDVAEVIKETKRVTTIWIHDEFKLLPDFYWQEGYGAFSVSHSHCKKLRDYIRTQEEHHQTKSFQDEFRVLLKKHEIAFEEPAIWD